VFGGFDKMLGEIRQALQAARDDRHAAGFARTGFRHRPGVEVTPKGDSNDRVAMTESACDASTAPDAAVRR
jgi:hypothetical protein